MPCPQLVQESFTFEQLSEDAKDKACESMRNSASYLDYDWYDCIYEDQKALLAEKFIDVDRIYFSGFCCQGDGACFDGEVCNTQTASFMSVHELDKLYPMIYKVALENRGVYVRVNHSGHYYHQYSTSFDIGVESFSSYLEYPEGDLRRALLEIWDNKLNQEIPNFEKDVTKIFRKYMQDIYKALEMEHDYLMSDEVVSGHIQANEYLFDEDGDRL